MGEFAIGQGVSRFEDPRLIRGGGRYTDDRLIPAWRTVSCCGRLMATPKYLDRYQRRQGSAWCAGRDHRRRLENRRLG
jgi:hypothetical protein